MTGIAVIILLFVYTGIMYVLAKIVARYSSIDVKQVYCLAAATLFTVLYIGLPQLIPAYFDLFTQNIKSRNAQFVCGMPNLGPIFLYFLCIPGIVLFQVFLNRKIIQNNIFK